MVASPVAARRCPQCSGPCEPEHQYCPTCGFPVATVARTSEDRFIGKTLPGGHRILDLISVGGMGRVYRAEQSVLGRTVAVKIIHPHLLSDDNSALRFLTEARAASQLNHPNSVSVFDFGRTEDGQPYLVMEFLRGKDLSRVAYEEGPLPFARIVDVLRQVLAALAEAHELGIVHRDLKPENVILEPMRRGGDVVKVVDFGLAKLKADTQAPNVTSPGIVCGTPDYMAPEQGRGDPIDGRSDLYAVGVMMFQLLTGRLPFEAESPTQVVMMHLSLPVPDPRQVAPERTIPSTLSAVVFRALEKDANKRYQDASEFSEALRQALQLVELETPAARNSVIPSATVVCPTCGARVPYSKFCGDCAARLPARPTPPETLPSTKLPLPLMGRDEELAFFEEQRRLASDRLIAVRLVGEPGSGKTRLLNEFATGARMEEDFVVLTGPDPFGAEVAYHSLREAIVGLTRSQPEAPRSFDGANPDAVLGLEEIFRGGALRDDPRSPLERRYGLAEALRWALEGACAFVSPHRVILIIDELHRIDGPSRQAFADTLSDPPAGSVLIIAAHPPGFDAAWNQELATTRVLGGLPPPTVARFLPSSPHLPRAETRAGGGVLPMYVEQALRYAQEGGTEAPLGLADLIALRVDTLEPRARRLLQALAVLGDAVTAAELDELVPSTDPLHRSIEELDRAGMLTQHQGTISNAHPLLREVVLAGIPAAVRRELHDKALSLRDKTSAPIEVCAHHAYCAEDAFQALLLLEQVAERAAALADTASEVFALRRGLEVARREIARGELDDPLKAMLIFGRKLGVALTRAGNYADAEGVLREALDIAGPSGTDRARVLAALAHVAHGRNKSKDAVSYLEQAIVAAEDEQDTDLGESLLATRRSFGG